jgi:hypothetical protein
LRSEDSFVDMQLHGIDSRLICYASLYCISKLDVQRGKQKLPRPLIHWLANEYITNTSCSLWQMVIQSYTKGSIKN